jgi:hypothetical protein
MIRVHIQQTGRCPTDIGLTFNQAVLDGKVNHPRIRARMEKHYNGASGGIDRGKIRAFERIATITRQCQVGWVVRSTMLPGDDVLDVQASGEVRLGHAAVFAPVLRAAAHQLLRGRVHQTPRPVSSLRALAWIMETMSIAST